MFQNHCRPRTLLTNFFFSPDLSVSSGLDVGPLEDDGEAGKAKMSFASRPRRFWRERVHTHSRQGLRFTGLMTPFFLHYLGYLGYKDGCDMGSTFIWLIPWLERHVFLELVSVDSKPLHPWP